MGNKRIPAKCCEPGKKGQLNSTAQSIHPCCRFQWFIHCDNRTFKKLTMRQVHFHSLQSRPSNHGDSRNPHGYKTTQNSPEEYKHKKDGGCYLLLLFHAFGKLSGEHQHPLNQAYWHQISTVRVPVRSLTSTSLPYFLFSFSLLMLFALALWTITSGSLLPLGIEILCGLQDLLRFADQAPCNFLGFSL